MNQENKTTLGICLTREKAEEVRECARLAGETVSEYLRKCFALRRAIEQCYKTGEVPEMIGERERRSGRIPASHLNVSYTAHYVGFGKAEARALKQEGYGHISITGEEGAVFMHVLKEPTLRSVAVKNFEQIYGSGLMMDVVSRLGITEDMYVRYVVEEEAEGDCKRLRLVREDMIVKQSVLRFNN